LISETKYPPTVENLAAAPPQALLLRHSKIAAVVRGEWSPHPRVTQSHSIFNSNKHYIENLVVRVTVTIEEEEEEENLVCD
jgi:hypothetical protein